MDTEASDLLNDLQVRLNNVLDDLSCTFGNRYVYIRRAHTVISVTSPAFLLIDQSLSFQFPEPNQRLHATDGILAVPDQRATE